MHATILSLKWPHTAAKPGILRNVDVGKLLDLHSFSGVLLINHNHNERYYVCAGDSLVLCILIRH